MRKWLVIFAVVALFTTACSNHNETAQPESTPSAATSVTPPGQFPITNEKITLKVMVKGNAAVEDLATNEFTKWYEDLTNVHVEWEVVPEKSAQEKLNLMLASEDYPDVILNFGVSSTLQMIYGSQGSFLPLNDLIAQYGTETKKVFDSLPQVKEAITAPDGNIYSLPQVAECFHCSLNQKLWINKKWLDRLGLPVPETTEQFYEVLKAFKERDPNGNGVADEIPLVGSAGGSNSNIDGFLMNAFIYNNPYNDAASMLLSGGRIDVAFDKPEWKEGLTYLRKLYNEGLISPQTFTQDEDQLKKLGENPDAVLIGAVPAISVGNFTRATADNDRWLEYTTVPPLQGPNGLKVAAYNPYDVARTGHFIITSASKHPEIAFRWADAMYQEEITLRKGYGRPDQEWRWAKEGEIGINGQPAKWFTTFDINKAQNISWATIGPHYRSKDLRYLRALTPPNTEITLYNETKANYDPFKQDLSKVIPPLFFTNEQASEIADLSKTINDYVLETTARFITGDLDIDSQWDAYVNNLKQMNLERYIQIYQEAYDTKYKNK